MPTCIEGGHPQRYAMAGMAMGSNEDDAVCVAGRLPPTWWCSSELPCTALCTRKDLPLHRHCGGPAALSVAGDVSPTVHTLYEVVLAVVEYTGRWGWSLRSLACIGSAQMGVDAGGDWFGWSAWLCMHIMPQPLRTVSGCRNVGGVFWCNRMECWHWAAGRVEQARGDPDAWAPLARLDDGTTGKASADGKDVSTKWVFSTVAGSPEPHSGTLGATDIILDVPMDVAAVGGSSAMHSGGGRRSCGVEEFGDLCSTAGVVPAAALVAVDDGVDSSSDGSDGVSSEDLGREEQEAIDHAAGAGVEHEEAVSVYDAAEAELAAALGEQDLDGLMDTLESTGAGGERRMADSLAGFGSMLRRQGVRQTLRKSMAQLADSVVGAVMDDADVAREAAVSMATGVRTTAQAGRATMVSLAARSTDLRRTLRRTVNRATMRRETGRRAASEAVRD